MRGRALARRVLEQAGNAPATLSERAITFGDMQFFIERAPYDPERCENAREILEALHR